LEWGDVTVDTLKQFGRKYLVTPDFLRVFRYQGINGETPEQLAALLKEETVIIGDNYFEEKGVSGRSLLNRFCKLNGDSLKSYRIAGVTKPVRFGDFVPASDSHYAMNFFGESWLAGYKESDVRYLEVCVRTHANCAPGFIERLRRDADKQFRVGNLLFEDIRSMQDIRRSFQLDDMNDFRNQLWGIGFLLLKYFHGFAGHVLVPHTAETFGNCLASQCGSNRKQIFVRLLSEGLLLLVTATVVALIIDLNVAYMEYTPLMDEKVMTVPRFLITVGTTLLLMALTMVGGIWIPARQAMKIQPAVALREE
jgi:putative ABC transport system permease protein